MGHQANPGNPERHNPDPANPERHNPDPGNPERHNPDPGNPERKNPKHPESRFITHGSQANASTIPVICCMPSPATCQEAVHKGHFHTGIDFSSQYEQLRGSPTTSLVHTIGFNNTQYAPLSAPQGSHHSPVQGQNFSNSALTAVDNRLILQSLCLPCKYTQGIDFQDMAQKPPPALITTKQSYNDRAQPTPMVKLLRDRAHLEGTTHRKTSHLKIPLDQTPTNKGRELINNCALLDDMDMVSTTDIISCLKDKDTIEIPSSSGATPC